MLNTSFPGQNNKYLKPADFQDQKVTLTYQGWKRKPNVDDPPTKKNAKTWKQKLIYQLRYSYPEYAVDEAGEKRLGRDGNPMRNSFYLPEYPQGYSIVYVFDEGELESGSLPLFKAFSYAGLQPGDKVSIKRVGKDKETQWFVRKVVPVMDVDTRMIVTEDELKPDDEVPF